MNKQLKEDKIKRFINDPEMNEAVKEVLLQSFLKGRDDEDVHSKAARFISTERLESAWRDMEAYKESDNDRSGEVKQVGL